MNTRHLSHTLFSLFLVLTLLLVGCSSILGTAQKETSEAVSNLKNEAIDVTNAVTDKVNKVNQAVDSVNNAVDSVNQAMEDVKAVTD